MFNQSNKSGGTLETTLTDGIGTLTLQARKAFSGTSDRSIKVLINDVEKCSETLAASEEIQTLFTKQGNECVINMSGSVKLTISQSGPQTTIDNITWASH